MSEKEPKKKSYGTTYLHRGRVAVVARLPALACPLRSPVQWAYHVLWGSGEGKGRKYTCFRCLTGPVLSRQRVTPCAGIVVATVAW